MKKKTRIKIIFFLVVMLAIAGRISNVNSAAMKTTTKIYALGETVELNGSFTDLAEENTAGYSVTLEKAEILTYEAFMERFEKPPDYFSENSRKTTALLQLRVKNVGNASGGISVNQLFLFNEAMSVFFSYDNNYLEVANPEIGSSLMGIRIQPDTEYTLYFPFVFDYGPKPDSYLDFRKEGEKMTFYLRVSTYPVKNFIQMEI